MRLILAIQCFFAILFGGALPAKALPAPPEPEEPEDKKQERERLAKELAEATTKLASLAQELEEAQAASQATKKLEAELKEAQTRVAEAETEAQEAREKLGSARTGQKEAEAKLTQARDHGALAVLAWLQREGRLIDFLMEDVDEYEDEQVGAAVRAIHKGCRKVLSEGLALEAILPGEEEERVEVPKGFDPVSIQLTGNVKGDPPFKGTLMHHGWRTNKVAVPVPETVDPNVLAAAEVEL